MFGIDDALLGALVSGGASLLGDIGSIFGGRSSAKQQQQEAEHMYKHRYRWMMRDMKAAGLNPILAYQQGAGGMAAPAMASFPNVFEGVAGTAREYVNRKAEATLKARQAEAQVQEVERSKSATELIDKQADQVVAATEGVKAAAERDRAATERERATAKQVEQETRLRKYDEPLMRADAEFYSSPEGQILRNVERATSSAGALGRGVGAVINAGRRFFSGQDRPDRPESGGPSRPKYGPRRR